MKQALKKVLPESVIFKVRRVKELKAWISRGFLENAPQFVKQNIFLKYGIPAAPWVETGTFLGQTTAFLLKHFGKVYTVEPGKDLYNRAVRIFAGQNVELFNGLSETIFPILIPTLKGDMNFWLDGHYSADITFRGPKDCPIEDELQAIKNNLGNFGKLSILIDDVRCFLPFNEDYPDYPSVDYLVDWARANGFNWRIEQDIFIMRNFA